MSITGSCLLNECERITLKCILNTCCKNYLTMITGIWARLTIRKLHSKFQVSSTAGTWFGQVLMWSSYKVVEFDIGPVFWSS